jgi:hypothetical protein
MLQMAGISRFSETTRGAIIGAMRIGYYGNWVTVRHETLQPPSMRWTTRLELFFDKVNVVRLKNAGLWIPGGTEQSLPWDSGRGSRPPSRWRIVLDKTTREQGRKLTDDEALHALRAAGVEVEPTEKGLKFDGAAVLSATFRDARQASWRKAQKSSDGGSTPN